MGILKKIEDWLQGKKSYLVVLAAVIGALLGYLNGQLDIVGLMTSLLAAFGLGGLRSAIGKIK